MLVSVALCQAKVKVLYFKRVETFKRLPLTCPGLIWPTHPAGSASHRMSTCSCHKFAVLLQNKRTSPPLALVSAKMLEAAICWSIPCAAALTLFLQPQNPSGAKQHGHVQGFPGAKKKLPLTWNRYESFHETRL